jgi:hypothetical protein
MTDLSALPWTAEAGGNGAIYVTTPDGNRYIGIMNTQELAEDACDAHNAALAARKAQQAARRSGATRMTGLTGVQIGDGGTQNNVF